MDIEEAAEAYAFFEVTWEKMTGETLPLALKIGMDPDSALRYAKRILDAPNPRAEARKIEQERLGQTEKKWWQFWK